MQSIKVNFQLLSSVATPMNSDTLFGSFCWAFYEQNGEDMLNKLLEDTARPFIVFSNAFPKECLPKPILAPVLLPDNELEFVKPFKKLAFVKSNVLQHLNNQKTLNNEMLYSTWKDKIQNKKARINQTVEVTTMHNSIDRHTLRVNSGQLYSTRETFNAENNSLDVYIKYNEEIIDYDSIISTITYMGQVGFGKDKNVGKGKFELVDSEKNPEVLKRKTDSNLFMSISNTVLTENFELQHGKLVTKFTKHGGDLAAKGLFQKNPIQVYIPGSTFTSSKSKEVYGKYLKNVSLMDGHVHSCWTIPIFIN